MQPDSEQDKQTTPKLSEEQLNAIYPTAKTVDEQYAEKAERQKRIESRRPKHLFILVGLSLYSALLSVLLIATAIPDLLGANPMSGVSAAFLLTIIWIGFARWVIGNVAEALRSCGLSISGFYALYVVCCLAPLIAIAKFFIEAPSSQKTALFYAIMTALHFIVVFALIAIGRRAVKKQELTN